MFVDQAARREYLTSHGLNEQGMDRIEYLCSKSPMRQVGKSALCNEVVYLYSPLMKRHLVCESRTVEALCYMLLELSGAVFEIYPQVEMREVSRVINGRRHVSTAHADALVLTDSGPVFVECKTREKLAKLLEERPDEYVLHEDGTYGRPAFEAWAKQFGCRYILWCPPDHFGLAWANAEFLYPLLREAPTDIELAKCRRIISEAQSQPITLRQALSMSADIDVQTIGRLIAHRILFANAGTGLLDHPDSIFLTGNAKRAEDIETEIAQRLSRNLSPLVVHSKVLTASETDIEKGRARLQRVREILAGTARKTHHYAPLVKAVLAARQAGQSELEVCITSYSKSGNTNRRLADDVYKALETVLRDEWEKKGEKRILVLQRAIRAELDRSGCASETPSTDFLRRAIAARNPDRHNHAHGGNRAFHQHRQATDTTRRTVNAIAPFSIVHIDATKFDHRSAKTTLRDLEFSCPVLYSCIDAGTGELLGRSLTFGPPSRFGIGALFRDIVRRHGRLPLMIMADRGSEMWSLMIVSLAEIYGLSLIMRPAGAGKFGSQIENALREINANVAHQLVGSTKPDQKGRSVDGKFKSYKTACLQFEVVVDVLDQFLFVIWPDRPIGELGATPRERIDEATAHFGRCGRNVVLDDSFLIATSVPIADDITVTQNRGVRFQYREYFHPELPAWIRANGKPPDVRIDSENRSLGYAKLGSKWVRLSTNNVLRLQVASELQRIFDGIYTADRARIARERKRVAAQEALSATSTANASVETSTGALDDQVDAKPADGSADAHGSDVCAKSDWDIHEDEEIEAYGSL